MEISLNPISIQEWSGSLMLVGLFEEKLEDQLLDFKSINKESLAKHLIAEEFKGKEGELTNLCVLGNDLKKIIFVGLGKKDGNNLNAIRNAIAKGARSFIGSKGTLGIMLPKNQINSVVLIKAVCSTLRFKF